MILKKASDNEWFTQKIYVNENVKAISSINEQQFLD